MYVCLFVCLFVLYGLGKYWTKFYEILHDDLFGSNLGFSHLGPAGGAVWGAPRGQMVIFTEIDIFGLRELKIGMRSPWGKEKF